jgi:hypothetical protein
MGHVLTNIGEEYLMENNMDGISLDIGLYNDSTDSISDTDDLSAITSEPSGSNYARQNDTFSTASLNSDYGFDNDSQLSFDTTDSSSTIDSYFLVANFDSDVAGDGGTASDHVIATGALNESRDLSDIDTLNVPSGGCGVTVD